MAMHSYMRANANQNQNQTNTVSVNLSPDEMHSFLKDKQAWEHAISLYQGPDPLDHWYNYICWYENHAHSDPEQKFRETLERCLTVYEHNDYYRQDVRLVRLWLKYIAMQTDQLRFYQVLFQRGTGRQVAAFYIGWASYYEAREQFKDAEAVFNLAFQEKAQGNAELQNAHTKFTYVRSLFYQQQHQQHPNQQHVQHQPSQLHQPPQPHETIPQMTPYSHAHHHQQEHPHQHHHHHQHQQHSQLQPQSHQTYSQPATSTPSRPHQLPQENFQSYQQHPDELAYHPHAHSHQQVPPQAHFQHQEQEQFQHAAAPASHNQASLDHRHYAPIVHQNHEDRPASHPHYEPHLQQVMAADDANLSQAQQDPSTAESSTQIEGVRLPRNFHAYGRNNHETWKPALTLEEPDDPSRICHYAKQQVYPPGAGVEYSPEELLARKYAHMLEQRKQQSQAQSAVRSNEPNETQHEPQLKKENIYSVEQEQQQQQIMFDSYESQNSYYMTAMNGEIFTQNDDEAEDEHSEEEDGDVEDEADHDQQSNQSVEEDSEDAESDQQVDDDNEPVKSYSNGAPADMLFRAQTTFEHQNRSIKMKFKKERTLESSTYSAYTIESIYHQQQELPSPAQMPQTPQTAQTTMTTLPASPKNVQDYSGGAGTGTVQRQRNLGHHFHPYMLCQTSTPKSIGNDNRRARVKARIGKFQVEPRSNSNSSCSVVEQAVNGIDAVALSATGDGTDATVAIAPIDNATFNDNANFSFSSAGGLDNSNSSLAMAVDRLHFRDATHVASISSSNNNKTLHPHNNNNNLTTSARGTALNDFSTFQENSYFATQHDAEAQERRLAKALETIARHLAKEAIDPFNSELCRAFLTKVNFPGDDDAHASYKVVQTPLPKISNTRTLNVLDSIQFNIDKEVGRGSYGSVYKATDIRTGHVVALKYQKPPNTWEIYICDQVLKRVQEREMLPGLMDISTAVIAPNASLIATEFSPFGSLLDINNKIRQATTKVMHESLVMHFSAQICNIVDHLHRQHIIHADIKPDNFLLMRVPSVDSVEPSLRLIDFGCAIDMSLFPNPEHTKFRKVVQTDGFTCIEMQEGRPWSYETDLFCIASTVHVMLFGEYMQPQKRPAGWDIRQKLPRYLKKHVWSKFFSDLLNMRADKLPQLQSMRKIFEEECYRMESELQKHIRTLSNILHRR
ncbi:uncharacterized protein LOC133845571 [Drosophila sulfurigaster albostrigata]|uniref:uncharacterized protein LOC133845571 n=1 Tax=Drosophila sulfurigaster albostrigata TaxID=89887 RepID=UPI002D21C03F|nr:uncharacterized protein LOC133845571 [Drosophila sulfurigaster albostrigata]